MSTGSFAQKKQRLLLYANQLSLPAGLANVWNCWAWTDSRCWWWFGLIRAAGGCFASVKSLMSWYRLQLGWWWMVMKHSMMMDVIDVRSWCGCSNSMANKFSLYFLGVKISPSAGFLWRGVKCVTPMWAMQILMWVIIPVHFHAFIILSFIHSFISALSVHSSIVYALGYPSLIHHFHYSSFLPFLDLLIHPSICPFASDWSIDAWNVNLILFVLSFSFFLAGIHSYILYVSFIYPFIFSASIKSSWIHPYPLSIHSSVLYPSSHPSHLFSYAS